MDAGVDTNARGRCIVIVNSLHGDLKIAMAAWALHASANSNAPLQQAVNQTVQANAYNFLQEVLIAWAIVALNRIHDPPREDRASLPTVLEFVSNHRSNLE